MGWNDEALGTKSSLEDQYRDWEKVSRPQIFSGTGDIYTPVYVELKPNVNPADIKAKVETENAFLGMILFDDLSIRCLGALEKDIKSIFRRFFIYIKESDVAQTEQVEEYFDILYIGVPLPIPQDTRPDPKFDDPTIQNFKNQVVTAVIDDFIAVGHDRFRTADGDPRVERFWAQRIPFQETGGPKNLGAKIGFGTKFNGEEIKDIIKRSTKPSGLDEELFFNNLYEGGLLPHTSPTRPLAFNSTSTQVSSDRQPHPNRNSAQLEQALYQRPFAFRSSHGTHVLDLAAGYDHEDAPDDRPIFAVQLPQLATAETWGARLNHFILTGLQQILLWAGDNPCVVNLSYAVFAGAKDGTDFLAHEMDRLVRERNDEDYDGAASATYLTLPSGNGYRASCHAHGTLTKNASAQTFRWTTQPDDLSDNALELFVRNAAGVTLDVSLPGERTSYTVPLGTERLHRFTVDKNQLAMIRVSKAPRQSDLTRVLITQAPTLNYDNPGFALMAGDCVLTLRGPADFDGVERDYHLDVQRDDTPSTFPLIGRQSYLDRDDVYEVDEVTGALDRPHQDSPISRSGTLTPFAGHGHPTPDHNFIAVVGGARQISDTQDALPALYTSAGDAQFRMAPSLSAYSDESRQTPGRIAAGTSQGSAVAIAGSSVAAPQVARFIADMLKANNGRQISASRLNLAVFKGDDPRLGEQTLQLAPGQGRVARREA